MTIFTIMASTAAIAQNSKATTVRTTFSRQTSVSNTIKADPAIVWKLLTTASDYPRWNSTVISIEGTIAVGEKIKLKATMAPKRVFKLKVTEMQPNQRLVWGDGQGTRVYTLAGTKGNTTFEMSEKIGGFMFPMYAKHIPPFDQAFEQFAADLKKEAETIQNTGR
jgi:uncharacterized protein YndB with AHSA1/START domain